MDPYDLAMGLTECPWCGKACTEIYYHLWYDHLPSVECLCGQSLYSLPGNGWIAALANHFEAEGGLRQHYYDIMMGVRCDQTS